MLDAQRILIFGGRNCDPNKVANYLLLLLVDHFPTVIIHGCARGADTGGALFAERRNIDQLKFSAEWDVYGDRAGPKRNARMLLMGQPGVAIEFPGRRGTKDMHNRLVSAGVPITIVTGKFT